MPRSLCGGQAAGGHPLPQPCSRCGRTHSPARLLSPAHGGAGEISSFFLSLLCIEGTHKSLPGPLLERDNNKRAVPRGFFLFVLFFFFLRIFQAARAG